MIEYSEDLRSLRETIEPIAASVYFVPETIQKLGALGLSPLEAYFCGRAAPMGRIEGTAVRSVFAFFKPHLAESAVESGWQKADPGAVTEARIDAIAAYMSRIFSEEPSSSARAAVAELTKAMESVPDAGRPLFAAWRSLEILRENWGVELWRACDLFREHRGAAHTAAWLISGLSPREAVVLSKHWWGMESNSYLSVHGWSDSDIAEAEEQLRSLGYLKDSSLTPAGRELRDEVEDLTDRMQKDVVQVLAGKFSQITEALSPLRDRIVGSGSYPMKKVPSRK